VIDIKQHPLRAFEQDFVAAFLRLVELVPDGLGKGQDKGGDIPEIINQPRAVDAAQPKARPQRIMMRAEPVHLSVNIIKMRQIADPDRATADLILIGRADPAPRGADLELARILAKAIEIAVKGQDERAGFGDVQILRVDINALRLQFGDLIAEMPGIKHNAVADDRKGPAHDARREERKLIGFIANHKRMPGIMSALKAHNHVCTAGEPVDDLALAFIAPLGTNHRYVGHAVFLSQRESSRRSFLRQHKFSKSRRIGRANSQKGIEMKHVLGMTAVISLLAAGGASAQDRLDRSCRREIVQLCGFDRSAMKSCLREKAKQLSPDCQLSLLKRIEKRAEAKAPSFGGTEMAYGKHAKQRLDFWAPLLSPSKTRPPLVIFVHGGGWSIGDKKSGTGEKAAHFTKLGYAFASLNYRLVPETDPGGQATDIANAIAYLRAQSGALGFDPNRIILTGHSAGAHLVALISSDEHYLERARVPLASLRGSVLLDGAGYDVPKQMAANGAGPMIGKMYVAAFGTEKFNQLKLSPITYATAPNAAQWLLIHDANRADSGEQSRELAAALRKAGASATVVPIPDSSHMKINNDLGAGDNFITQHVDAFVNSALNER
jgi:arylformamidase